jgi:putative acetyltransferase
MDVEVRDAVPADAAAVREVHVAAIEGLGPEAYAREQVEAWAAGCESADYEAAMADDSVEFVVATDERVVAFGSLQADAPDGYEADVDGEVTGVYVHPSVARRGVGSAVYAELERRAEAAGLGALGLLASLNAVPFYEAHGYRRVRERSHEFSSRESTGVEGTVVEMRKPL